MQILQDLPTSLGHLPIADPSWYSHLWQSAIDSSLLAQQTYNTDVFAGARAWFDNFVASGQAWALVLGLIIGYLFRSFTSYG